MPTPDRPKPPTPTCAPAHVGPCAGCGHPTHKYGPEAGGPLCSICRPPVLALRRKTTTA